MYFQELELIEEQWRAESNDLVTLVSNLQEENRRLQKLLVPSNDLKTANTITTSVPCRDDVASNSTTSDFQVLQRLRGQIEKHRKEMKVKDAELSEAEQTAQGVNMKHSFETLVKVDESNRLTVNSIFSLSYLVFLMN